MDIVLITRGDRVELLEQTITSMQANAADWSKHRLVVVFDGSDEEAWDALGDSRVLNDPEDELESMVIVTGTRVGVGGAKNFGARDFSKCDGAGLLMFSDSDMFYLPGWDARLELAMHLCSDRTNKRAVTQLGGWRHPHHVLGQPLIEGGWFEHTRERVAEVDAVTGNCFVIRWADWLKYGPFDANAIGPGQSEDYALSQRIKAGVGGVGGAGGVVATLDPPVAIHCGLVNSDGEPAVGWREMEEMVTGQLAALDAGMGDEIVILRPAMLPQWGEGESPIAPGVGAPNAAESAKLQRGAEQLNAAAVEMGLMQPLDVIRGIPNLGGIKLRREISVEEARIRYPHNEGPVVSSAQYDRMFPGRTDSPDSRPIGLNVASGQRRFASNAQLRWVNVDAQSVPPDRIPDIQCNVGVEPLPFADGSVQYVVIHQGLEHAGCGEATPMLLECWRVLARGGSLIVTVPDMRKLAARWLGGELSTQVYMTNVYGAFMGDEADRHKWGGDEESWTEYLRTALGGDHAACTRSIGKCACNGMIRQFNWREIPGASIAKDFWIVGIEAIKP